MRPSRVATADAVVGGVPIPKGSKLLLVQASANFDPRHFENPDEVDVYRESAVEHLTFGYGAHQCMGKNIGRMQMREFIEEFVRRLPHMRLVEGQQIDYLSNTSFRGPSTLWVEWDPARNPERLAANTAPALAAFTIEATAAALKHAPKKPLRWLVTGGGRKNAAFMEGLAKKLGVPVEPVEAVGWDGDLLEAQCFAYLAVRSTLGLPLSLPTTTGVPKPMTGGALWQAA